MLHKEIDINGQNIAYYESEGKGSAVLFVHGNSMSGLSFEKQISSRLGEKHRLVAIDLPGHGRSSPAQHPKTDYTLRGYAAVVSGFAKRLEIADALLVGWSLGGHVILEASSRLPKSAGLMIFGTPPVGKPIAAAAYIPHPLMPMIFTSALSREETASLTEAFFMPDSQVPAFFYDDMRRTDGRAREALGLSIGEGDYTDEVAVVANMKRPLAIIHGESDPLVSLLYIKGLSIPKLWRSEVQIINDAGHTPQWEKAERFNELLKEFTQEV